LTCLHLTMEMQSEHVTRVTMNNNNNDIVQKGDGDNVIFCVSCHKNVVSIERAECSSCKKRKWSDRLKLRTKNVMQDSSSEDNDERCNDESTVDRGMNATRKRKRAIEDDSSDADKEARNNTNSKQVKRTTQDSSSDDDNRSRHYDASSDDILNSDNDNDNDNDNNDNNNSSQSDSISDSCINNNDNSITDTDNSSAVDSEHGAGRNLICMNCRREDWGRGKRKLSEQRRKDYFMLLYPNLPLQMINSSTAHQPFIHLPTACGQNK